MHSERGEPFFISIDAANTNENRSIEKSHIFFKRLFKMMRTNDKALYFHINRNIHTSKVPYIYKKISLFTYGVVREELKRRNVKIRINQYDIDLHLLNKNSLTEAEKKVSRDDFFVKIEQTSPAFYNQVQIFTKQLPPGITASKEVFERALMDIYEIFTQKLEAREMNEFWFGDDQLTSNK